MCVPSQNNLMLEVTLDKEEFVCVDEGCILFFYVYFSDFTAFVFYF